MFTKRFKLFRLMGFDVHIDLSWFIIAILITWSLGGQNGLFSIFYPDLTPAVRWSMGVAGALGLFASIVLHELGHSLVARRFGMPMRGITLFIFGGVAEMSDEPPSAKAEFWVAIGGPIVSVVLAVGCYGLFLASAGTAVPIGVSGVLWYLGLVNGLVVMFNMIPAFPLDGGRVLRSALWHVKGSLRWATRITSSLGSGFGMFLILVGVLSVISGNFIGGIWQFLLGMFLRGAAQMSYQQVVLRRALEGEPVERFIRRDLHTVTPSTTVGDFIENYLYEHHHKLYPVVEGDELRGCVTVQDVKKVPREEWGNRTVGDITEACSEENTISSDLDTMKALSKLQRANKSRVMVVDDGKLEGMLALKDLMNFIALKVELEEESGPAASSRLKGESAANHETSESKAA